MFQQHRRTWITALAAVLCITACITGWLIYDYIQNNTDHSGWEQQGQNHYYRNFQGERVWGWQEIDGKTYYFGLNRAMHRGWLTTESGSRFYFGEDGTPYTGWLDTEEGRYYFNENGNPQTDILELDGRIYLFDENGIVREGWYEKDGQRRYLLTDGLPRTGWMTEDGCTFYLNEEDGTPHTGWLQQDEYRYYFREDGTMVTGPAEIDGRTYYFTPKGIEVLLVNRNHPVPHDYTPDLVSYGAWFRIDRSCLPAMNRMLSDCQAAGYSYEMNSIYRTINEQWMILNLRTEEYTDQGMTYTQAYATALRTVAYPGTSEHHLGLAADILGSGAQAWLQEHCWEYGFILRYPEGKTHITGIIHEPWHFRYVGTEVSMDMKDTGLCLEEYLGAYAAEPEAQNSAA